MKPVSLISYHYPNILKVSVMNRIYTFETSEYWARRVIRQISYGDGYKGLNILKKNGTLISRKMVHGERNETRLGGIHQ